MDFNTLVKKKKISQKLQKKEAKLQTSFEAIDTTSQGPFAGNYNNLKFLIVEKKEIIREIADYCDQDWIGQAPALILVLSNDTHLENLYGERGRIYSRQQAGAAIQTLLLKLTDFNIDSCWVGAYEDELVKNKLKIPQHIQIEAVIPVGYGNDRSPKKRKKELENVLYWERWENTKRPSWFEEEREDYRPGRFD